MTPDPQPLQPSPWKPWLFAGSLWLMLAAVASFALWHLHRDAIDNQRRELGLLSLALTDEIDRGLRGAEEGLRALQGELQDGELAASGSDVKAALHTRAELMPLVQSLWLVDRRGRVLAASDAIVAPTLTGFLPDLRQLARDGIALSRPFGPGPPQDALVALATPIPEGPGLAGGWIVAAMPSRLLLGAFSVALPAADARMGVVRADGVLLAAAHLSAAMLDEALQIPEPAEHPALVLRRSPEGSQNLVGLHVVPRYGLRVVVSRDLGVVLMSWWQATQVTTVALALLLVGLALAVHLVLRAERRRSQAQHALQAQLARAGKLESLGTLAGGVAHDFNNVLAGIVGFGEMAQDAAPPGSDQARHLDRVLQAALRGKALVERILAFSRGGARADSVFELEPVVEEVLALLAASLRPGIVLERAFDAGDGRLRGDPTQAFEAVMNLCTNALQAMPDGGMLSVQLQRRHVATPQVLSHSALASGDYLALSVSDQGGGITPEVMEHLFEPFFTTRASRSGTGLGLAVVHGVVAEFGGAIDVTSRVGQGARFTLYLPECHDPVGAADPVVDGPAPGVGQRLLVVDDEPDLVGLALEMLQGLGYEPEGFIDPVTALQALRERPWRFAAVITDEVMPGLSGVQLTEALRAFAPTLPVLLVSGYGGALLAQRAAVAGVTRVLAKPLQRAELARMLAQLLQLERAG